MKRILCFILGITGLFFYGQADLYSAMSPPKSVVAAASRPSAYANSGNVGLGVMFGEPTGLTLKSWLSETNAFDVGLTYSFTQFFEILADYLWHFPRAFSGATRGRVSNEFVPYIGIGAVVFFETTARGSNPRYRGDSTSNAGFGARIPLGIEFLPRRTPIGVFAELAPGLSLAPGVFGFMEGGVGIRFYF